MSTTPTETQKKFSKLDSNPFSKTILKYPEELGNSGVGLGSYILFNIFETTGAKFTKNSKKIVGEQPTRDSDPVGTRKTLGATGNTVMSKTQIALHMPEFLTTNYSTNWEMTDLDAPKVVEALNNISDNMNSEAAQNMVRGNTDLFGKLQSAAETFGIIATDAAQAVFRRYRNPYIEFLFRGVNARTFVLEFKFMPRSERESREVDKIIREFKKNAMPTLEDAGTTGVYYRYPSEFDIKFYSNGKENEWLWKSSTCALVSISHNVTPSGQYASFRDLDGKGAPPAQINLNLTFSELELMTRQRMEEGF